MRQPRSGVRLALVVAVLGLAGCSRSRDPPGAASELSFETVLAVGESLYYRAEYDSARALWTRALEGARARGDSAAEARLLTWFGIAAWKQGDLAAARRLGEEALALKLRLGLSRDLFKSYNALGLVAWHEGRLRDALEHFVSASDAARAAGDGRGLAAASGNIGLVRTELGEFAEARHGFLAARDAARALGDPRIEANALTNLGMLDIRVGDPQSAIAALAEARRLYRSAGLVEQEQNALGQLGTAYRALGDQRLALAALDSALELARAQGLRQEEASNLEALAEIYREAGDFRRALSLYTVANRINAEVGLEVESAADLRSEAEIHLTLGDLDRARRHAAEALAVHRRLGARHEELVDLLLLADVAARAARSGEAVAHLAAARRLAGGLDARLARAWVGLAEARIADRSGNAGRVLQALGSAAPDLAQGGYGLEWETEALRARALARLGRLDVAVAAGRRAVRAVERVRGGFGSGVLRTSYVADKSSVYGDLVGVLVQLGRVKEAFEVSDAARGRALLEYLGSAEAQVPALRALQAGEELLRLIDALLGRIAELEEGLASEPDSPGRALVAELYGKLERVRAEYEDLYLRTLEHGGAPVLLGGAPTSAAGVQAALRADEVLLEYLVTPDRLFIFAVSQGAVRVLLSPMSGEDLVARVRLARDLLDSRDLAPEARAPVLGALYDALIAPAVRANALAGARRLIVVPHGVLVYLPFAALRDRSTGRYLVEEYALVHLPSASALPALRSGATGAPAAEARVAVFAPEPEGLPASRAEARAVGWAAGGVRSVIGRRATERRVRQALAEAQVVHVASHGVMNPANPLFSRIELAPGGDQKPTDDGRLEVHELLGQRVASMLVFLSGCETGLGAAWSTGFSRGEDFATLGQAFLYAGAKNVVATLWRVEDEGAAAFAERFYRRLGGAHPADALAEAQRNLMQDARFQAPYYWAAYQLAGDGTLGGAAQQGVPVSVAQ